MSVDRTFLEFFSGAGLIHKALERLGWQAVFANDNCEKKVTAYKANFPTVPVSPKDIRSLRVRDIPSALLATASFPCIDLSQAGGRKGLDGEHSSVVWRFLEILGTLRKRRRAPRYVLIENVPGLLYHHGGKDIDALLKALCELGYAVDVVQVNASHFLPQARNRVFIIGVPMREFSVPDPAMPDVHIRRYHVGRTFERNRDLPWAPFDFPELPQRRVELGNIFEQLPHDDPRWWTEERMDYFWERLERGHEPRLQQLRAAAPDSFLTAVRRGRRRGIREQIINLRFDGLASCLRTPKGGSSTQFVVQVADGNVRVRRILGLESAKLQGVRLPQSAPHFNLVGSEQDQLFAFGDAVCVPVVTWVVKHTIERAIQGSPVSRQGQLQFSTIEHGRALS